MTFDRRVDVSGGYSMATRTELALATILALFSGVVVYGQVDRANLNGTVMDSSRAVVADARVEVVSRETGLKRAANTGPTGIYSITGLPIGTYDVTISRAGFRTFEVTGIQLFVGETRTMDAELQLGTVSEELQVEATVAPLETTNARVGAVLEHQQLDDIPINGRNWATLETLAPGAINAGSGGQRDIRFVGRGRDDNNFTFDGIDATGVQEQSQKADARLNISLESNAAFRSKVLASSPVLKPILDAWPIGQTPVDASTDLYTAAGVNSVRENSVTARVDHTATDRTSLFVRYNIDDAFIDKPFDSIGSRDTESIRPSNLVVQAMHVFSDYAVNETKFGMNRSPFRHPVLGTAPVAVQSVPGFTDLSPDQLDLEVGTTFSWSDNLSIIQGRHTFKMGADIRRVLLDNTSAGVPVTTIAFSSSDD